MNASVGCVEKMERVKIRERFSLPPYLAPPPPPSSHLPFAPLEPWRWERAPGTCTSGLQACAKPRARWLGRASTGTPWRKPRGVGRAGRGLVGLRVVLVAPGDAVTHSDGPGHGGGGVRREREQHAASVARVGPDLTRRRHTAGATHHPVATTTFSRWGGGWAGRAGWARGGVS